MDDVDASELGRLAHVGPSRGPMAERAAASAPDGSGRPWLPVRVIAVSRASCHGWLNQDYMQVVDRPEGRVGMVCLPGGPGDPDVELHYAFYEGAVPIVQDKRAAAALCLHMLKTQAIIPGFPVEACIVWIGDVRYWVEFQPPWPHGSPVDIAEFPLPPEG